MGLDLNPSDDDEETELKTGGDYSNMISLKEPLFDRFLLKIYSQNLINEGDGKLHLTFKDESSRVEAMRIADQWNLHAVTKGSYELIVSIPEAKVERMEKKGPGKS